MTLSNVGSILATLTQLRQFSRTSALTHRVKDLSVPEFICLLDFITAEFQQFLRAIEMINDEALETMLDQVLEAIALKIGQILQAEHTTIFLVDRDRGQLRSKIVQDNTEKSIEISTPLNVGIAGHVATTGEYLNIPDASSHQLFNSELETQLGFQIRNILCMPILSSKDQVMAVVQLTNKAGNIPFDNNDEERFRDFAASISTLLETCLSFQKAARHQVGTNALLRATASLAQSRDLDETMRLVMEKARELMQADRSTLFMLSKEMDELWTKIATADGEKLIEIRIPANRGIVGYVVSTGQVVNIPDAYKDSRFDPTIDRRTGYVTRNILCLPVLNSANDLIGVIQLINKHQDHFTSSDEELMRAFNIQAGMALENAQVLENVRVLLEQQQSNKEFLIGADESSKRLLNLSEEDRLEGQLIADAHNEQQASPVSIGISDEKQLKSTNDDAISFPSLSSLRSAHSELLKRHRESGSTAELLAEMEEFIYRGRATGALLDTDEDRWASQSLLDYWSAILYRAGREPPDATLAEFDPALAPELDDARCPYLGLEAFREEKSNLFYGRQRLLEKLVNHLKENRLLAVIGSSGSGKSSVVLGGLLPKLKVGALSGSENWHYYSPMVPGVNPLENLALIAQPRDVNATGWLQQQVESFQRDPNHLTKLSNEFGNRPCVLVVDQFEEVFTLCREDNVRQAFIDNLIGLIQSSGVRHTVILTMRTDFESQVARVPIFKDLFEQVQVRVTALDASELREAIEKPAELVGLKFEEGLVEALLQDVLGEPAALPLLQFTLLKLWDNRERNRVTWETYKRLGSGRQALARSANEFYEQLIPEEQVTVKRILLRMVRPTEGLEVTSNRIQRKTLYKTGEARDRVDRVLEKLIEARLVRLTEDDTPDDAQVEVAHEALVRNWPRLVEWLEDERVNLRRRWRLVAAVEDWQARGRDKSVLLRGSLLAEAQRYEDLNALEIEFIQCSVEEEQKVLKNQTLSEILKRVEANTHTDEDLNLLKQLLNEGNFQAVSQLEKPKLDIQRELINTKLEAIEELRKVTQLSKKQNQELNSVRKSFSRLEKELIETEKITNKLLGETVKLLESKLEELSLSAKASLEFEKVSVGVNSGAIDIIKEILIDENSQSQGQEFRYRQALLKQVKNEVDSRLAQSLHSAMLINLGKEKQPQQVKPPWDVDVNVSNQPSEPLPQKEKIIDFFDREAIAGKFLILGAPGSGKTTTLLELAEELISRAEDNAKQPIPVLFNLSTWQDDRQSIAQWLVAELKDKYGVRKDIGKNWLKEHELLPLLDGLDELASERQEECVQAINQFLASEERSLYLVVCSRSEEYRNYETRLQLNGAIYLQPLSNRQIRHYLAAVIRRADLMQTISRDPTLLELIRTPLLLSVTTLAFIEISLEQWQRLNTSEERLRYLLDAYIRRMLAREINSQVYSRQKLPSPQQVQCWLAWLARQLQRESQTEFLLERMQPSWLTNFFAQQAYALGVGLVFGSVGGLLVGLIVGLNCTRFLGNHIGLIIGVIIGLFFGFFFGLWAWLALGQSKEIKPVETLNSSWSNLGKSLIVGTIIGFITWVITKVIFPLIGWDSPGLVLLLIIGPAVVSVFEMNGPEVQRTTVANQGIWQSRNNAIRFALLGAAWMGVAAFWAREKIFATITSLILKSSAQSPTLILSATDTVNIVLSGILVGLFFGLTQAGTACIQHFILRVVLYFNGFIPWNYKHFLDYATKRMLLQRVGGRYRFIHRLLQEHFAQMELNQESESES